MAIKKSSYSRATNRLQSPSPYVVNQPVEIIVSHTFTEALPTTDILELVALPPNCKILAANLMTEGTGATTITAGFMSGDFGSNDPARTSGSELFSAVTPTTEQSTSLVALAGLATSDAPRSIGVRGSANIAANAATKLHLRLRYVTGQS